MTGSVASAGRSLNWELDLFGHICGSVESSRSRLDASKADARAVRLSLAAQVAVDAAQRALIATEAQWRAGAVSLFELEVACCQATSARSPS